MNRATGGPALSVTRLAAGLAELGLNASIFSLDYPELGPVEPAAGVSSHTALPNPFTRPLRGWSPRLKTMIEREVGRSDIVHNHGLWMLPTLYARRAAARARRPLIISPRGMLEPWSLQQSRWKKRVVWSLFEHRNLRSAFAFHATSQTEAESIRALGFRQPVAVIANGVELPDGNKAAPPRDVLESRFPQLKGKRWLLFLSRLHAKKGVDLLIDSWSSLAPQFSDWRLVIAGKDLNGERAGFESQAARSGAANTVVFTGLLQDEAKACALAHSELFVLPTRSENFGIAIAEALAHRMPVITTTAAPWGDIRTERCGWWIDVSSEALVAALREGLSVGRDELRAMGERGHQLVARKYSWRSAAAEMRDFYFWCCGRGDKPPCVSET